MNKAANAIVTIDSLSLTFEERKLFSNFSLTIFKGEKITVSGESGSGKSTLLKTLIAMHLPLSGTIALLGNTLETENLLKIRRQMFYLPQEILPHSDETVLEYLEYPFSLAINKGVSFPEQSLHQLLSELHLSSEILSQPLGRLSGGERKRIGVLCGLLLNRPLMLLDEPTAGVDAGNRDTLVNLLFGEKNRTVIAVSHDEAVHKRSDRTIILGNGSSGADDGSS